MESNFNKIKPNGDSKKEKVLFISNALFVDLKQNEGGVQVCTNEFIELLQHQYEVIVFPVYYKYNLYKKLQIKTGLNVYNDYDVNEYKDAINKKIKEYQIRFVFLNLSNTIRFSSSIKKTFGNQIKVIICSHGNETGDLLHEHVRFKKGISVLKRFTSPYLLGKLLKAEAHYRNHYIDMVLTVSPVEEQIENWLGTRHTFMVPRTIKRHLIIRNPQINTIGFIGDLRHWPNRFGIQEICKQLSLLTNSVNVRIIGAIDSEMKALENKYSFVKCLGYLPTEEIHNEISSWSLFINPVFYYSRGVSTKLAKALGWGLPVISTIAGNRGYKWERGEMLVAKDPSEMAQLIIKYAGSPELIKVAQEQTEKIVESAPTLNSIMSTLSPVLENL